MTDSVLDASALIAFLRKEPGTSKVAVALPHACISAVNLSETLAKLTEYGSPLSDVTYQIERLRIAVIPFDAEQAGIAASLHKATRAAGLSLGDRACLALAMQRSAPAFTTERDWSKCKLGIEIVNIR